MSTYLRNIAIFGGSGAIGKHIVQSLLNLQRFTITAISRPDSSASFPDSVRVVRGAYTDEQFLTSTLKDQDAVIIVLGHTTAPEIQSTIIKAAAAAGVPWVLPTEFGSDCANEKLVAVNQLLAKKGAYRKLIEDLGVSKWIGIANNPIYEMSLTNGFFQIDIKARKATLYDHGSTKFSISTFTTIGHAVAALLALPVEPTSPGDHALSRYANAYAYVSTFRVSQREILEAVQKATNTNPSDWRIENESTEAMLARTKDSMQTGDFKGVVERLGASHFVEGLGGDFVPMKGNVCEFLGVPEEDPGEVTRSVVASLGSEFR